jgi:hypothetical protein
MEGKPRREGRNLGAILTPRSEVVKALNDAKRLREKEKKKAKEARLALKTETVGEMVTEADDDDDDIGGVLAGE